MGNSGGKTTEVNDVIETWEERETRLRSESTPRTLKCDYCSQLNQATATYCENCGKTTFTCTITRRKSRSLSSYHDRNLSDSPSTPSMNLAEKLAQKRETAAAPTLKELQYLHDLGAPPDLCDTPSLPASPPAEDISIGVGAVTLMKPNERETKQLSSPHSNSLLKGNTFSQRMNLGTMPIPSNSPQKHRHHAPSSISSSLSSESLHEKRMNFPSEKLPPAKPVTAEILQNYNAEKVFIPIWPCGLELNDHGEVLGVEPDSLAEMLMNIQVGDVLYNVKDRPVDLGTIDTILPCEGTFLRPK